MLTATKLYSPKRSSRTICIKWWMNPKRSIMKEGSRWLRSLYSLNPLTYKLKWTLRILICTKKITKTLLHHHPGRIRKYKVINSTMKMILKIRLVLIRKMRIYSPHQSCKKLRIRITTETSKPPIKMLLKTSLLPPKDPALYNPWTTIVATRDWILSIKQ